MNMSDSTNPALLRPTLNAKKVQMAARFTDIPCPYDRSKTQLDSEAQSIIQEVRQGINWGPDYHYLAHDYAEYAWEGNGVSKNYRVALYAAYELITNRSKDTPRDARPNSLHFFIVAECLFYGLGCEADIVMAYHYYKRLYDSQCNEYDFLGGRAEFQDKLKRLKSKYVQIAASRLALINSRLHLTERQSDAIDIYSRDFIDIHDFLKLVDKQIWKYVSDSPYWETDFGMYFYYDIRTDEYCINDCDFVAEIPKHVQKHFGDHYGKDAPTLGGAFAGKLDELGYGSYNYLEKDEFRYNYDQSYRDDYDHIQYLRHEIGVSDLFRKESAGKKVYVGGLRKAFEDVFSQYKGFYYIAGRGDAKNYKHDVEKGDIIPVLRVHLKIKYA